MVAKSSLGPGPKRILYVVDQMSQCAWYRCSVPGYELAQLGHDVGLTEDLADPNLPYADIVVMLRHFSREALELMRAAKSANKLVVYDIDDALWDLDPTNPAYQFYSRPSIRQGIEACIRAADVVTTTTEPLAKKLRGLNRRVIVLPNMLPAEVWPFSGAKPQNDEHVIVGWGGGPTHYADLEIIRDVGAEILDAYSNVWLACAGLNPTPFAPHPRLALIPPVPIEEYSSVLSSFDIGLAPLVDSAFNRSKSDLKALEYSMVGIPVVASNVEAYKSFVKDGETGFLVKSQKQWREALGRLIEDRGLREEMGGKANALARQRLIAGTIGMWVDAYGLSTKTKPSAVAVAPVAMTDKPQPLLDLRPTRRGAIDVIMPVFDCAEYLHAAVESVEQQTYGASMIRLIAVDDGSTDASREVLEEIGAASPLVVEIVACPENRGANVARNIALERSDAEFVYFMDADAMLRADAFAKLAGILANPEMPPDIGFAFSSFRRLWVPNQRVQIADGRVGVEDVHPGPFDIRRLRQANYISMMSLVRRSALPPEGFDEAIERFQDWDMWLTLYERGFVGLFLDEALFSAYVRGGGISEDPTSYERLQRIVANKHTG